MTTSNIEKPELGRWSWQSSPPSRPISRRMVRRDLSSLPSLSRQFRWSPRRRHRNKSAEHLQTRTRRICKTNPIAACSTQKGWRPPAIEPSITHTAPETQSLPCRLRGTKIAVASVNLTAPEMSESCTLIGRGCFCCLSIRSPAGVTLQCGRFLSPSSNLLTLLGF